MSLKTFHVFFIFFAALFTLGMGAWLAYAPPQDMESYSGPVGYASLALGAIIACYGVWFLCKKYKTIKVD